MGLLSRNKCEECRISGSRKRGKWQSYVMTSPKLPRNKWHEEWRSKWRDPTWFLRSARPCSTLGSEYMCLLTNWLFDEKYRFPLHLCLLFFQPWRNLCQSQIFDPRPRFASIKYDVTLFTYDVPLLWRPQNVQQGIHDYPIKPSKSFLYRLMLTWVCYIDISWFTKNNDCSFFANHGHCNRIFHGASLRHSRWKRPICPLV